MFSGNSQHNFAAAAAALPQLKGLSHSFQRDDSADYGPHHARINQGSDFGELSPVGLDDEKIPTGMMFLGIGF